MNGIIERFLLPLFFIMSVLYAFNSLSNAIELKKVFHHIADGDSYLERGSLSLYFSCDPHIQEVKKATGAQERESQSFFFPHAMVTSNECKGMIDRINNTNDFYTIKIENLEFPEKGILVTFNCDVKKIGLSYELFDSIGLQRGIVFHLYNKELINQLQEKNNQPLLRMLHHSSKPRIGIDFGHGGTDCGTIGVDGIKEKEVCLAIGTNVARMLEDNGYAVVLTRTRDSDLALDQRTLCANKNLVDFFVSIHANYSFNNSAMGVETFCLNQNLFKEQYSCLSDKEKKTINMLMNDKNDYSYKLAQSIQEHIGKSIMDNKEKFVDRKVKSAVAQVLLGAQMPSVLVEVGFLSHEKESQLLNTPRYQKVVAQGIFEGIMAIISL